MKKWFWFLGLALASCTGSSGKKDAPAQEMGASAPQDGMQAVDMVPTQDAAPTGMAASEPEPPRPAADATALSAPPVPPADWNAVAALLAGFPEKLPEKHASVRDLPAFKTYVRQIETLWQPVQKKKNVVEKWVASELGAANRDCKLLFYPFSGPDFLHVHLLFPGCREVVMIGLEPPGTLPEMSAVLDHHPDRFFQKMAGALTHILTLSFFRTKSMKEDLFGKDVPEINGTLAPILFMLGRTEYRITNIERVQLDWEGRVVPWTGTLPEPPGVEPKKTRADRREARRPRKPKVWKPYDGLRYTYVAPGETAPRTLTYFSCNLADGQYRDFDGIVLRADLQKYLRSLAISSTYIKAASYLMHEAGFSWIRNFILERSPRILQDDSGIPLRFFDEKKWDLTLYGHYDVPIEIFLKYTQADLAHRYAERKAVKPLPFGIGYKVYPGRSNLQLAVRRP